MAATDSPRGEAANPYDVVAYPGRAFADTHPARLAAVGILHGMEPSPVERCRVLELGCGDGANLLPMAHQLPGSRFVGLDLAAAPIARGRARAAALGVANLELLAMDLLDVTPALGEFDYIIAHGVYSWVPEPVRERILSVAGSLLAPQGIAFVSYLANPGTQMRDVLRQLLLRYGSQETSPAARVLRARELAAMLAGKLVSADPFQQLQRTLARELLAMADGSIYHDWLAPINAAVRITDFVAQADRHGLAFLGEAEYFMMCWQHDPLLAEARPQLARLEAEDVLAREQLLDDLRCRRFRQTLLRRAGAPWSPPTPERVQRLAAASRLRPVGDPDVTAGTIAEFVSPHGVSVKLDHPVAKAALVHLADERPRAVWFPELLAAARAAAGGSTDAAGDEETLGAVLLACAGAGHVQLCTWAPPLVPRAGEHPRASTLARTDIEAGDTVTTLRHEHLKIDDPLGAALLRLLDGTRDRAALAGELLALVQSGQVPPPAKDVPDGDLRSRLTVGLDESLEGLARAGLLEA